MSKPVAGDAPDRGGSRHRGNASGAHKSPASGGPRGGGGPGGRSGGAKHDGSEPLTTPIVLAKPTSSSSVHAAQPAAAAATSATTTAPTRVLVTKSSHSSSSASSTSEGQASSTSAASSSSAPGPSSSGSSHHNHIASICTWHMIGRAAVGGPLELLPPPATVQSSSFQPVHSILLNSDVSNYHVVGVLGRSGVGKSSLMNAVAVVLGRPATLLQSPITPATAEVAAAISATAPFATWKYKSSRRTVGAAPSDALKPPAPRQPATHLATSGIHTHMVGPVRTILMDTQPMLHFSNCSTNNSGATVTHDLAETLNVGLFLLSTCHTIVLVCDDVVADASLLRLLKTLVMLRPACTPTESVWRPASAGREDAPSEQGPPLPPGKEYRTLSAVIVLNAERWSNNAVHLAAQLSLFHELIAHVAPVVAHSLDLSADRIVVKTSTNHWRDVAEGVVAHFRQSSPIRPPIIAPLDPPATSQLLRVTEREWLRHVGHSWKSICTSPALADYLEVLRLTT
ncbi:hypothetical protein CAOG_000826 [Capsaspora owczarzaki ATCC 30864]|uniref:G domain-containing protein n=1 Tax=Capsaspora owczarzaki (strain ATCC 30864) TaxID=595528 RepID=A0A0D2U280_CAPO3|nr:hypothetical protein CAOG_000826 [Capsaspora owczarzaki ATCC 30864]